MDKNYEFKSNTDSVRLYIIETQASPEDAEARRAQIEKALNDLGLEGRGPDSIKITVEALS